jgi:hypothetical protein
MSAARIAAIASGITAQAKNSAGVWRDLVNNDLVYDREELLMESDSVCYAVTAAKLQKRVAGVWTDSASLTLSVPDGSSHFRKVRIAVSGDATNSVAAVLFTSSKGEAVYRQALESLQAQQRIRFTLNADTTRFRGIADELEHANKAELGGFEQDFKGMLLCDREQFVGATEGPPERGDAVTVNSRTYRVESVKEDEVSYLVELASVNR